MHDLTTEMTEQGHVGTDAMFRELIDCAQERRQPLTAGTEMVECVRMCLAGQEAMRQRAVVTYQGVGFRSLQESIDTTSPEGTLIFHMFGALAEYERNMIESYMIDKMSYKSYCIGTP